MATQELKKIKSLAIAGAGGIGSFVCQFLLDYGVNRNQFPITDWQIDCYDNDVV